MLSDTRIYTATLRADIHTTMSAHLIPRKEVGAPSPAHLKEVEARHTPPESGWDIPEDAQKKKYIGLGTDAGASASRWAIADRFDRILPPHRRYFGRSRHTLLIVIGIAFLCLLALIVGLAVGLSGKSKYGFHIWSKAKTHHVIEPKISPFLAAFKHILGS